MASTQTSTSLLIMCVSNSVTGNNINRFVPIVSYALRPAAQILAFFFSMKTYCRGNGRIITYPNNPNFSQTDFIQRFEGFHNQKVKISRLLAINTSPDFRF